MGESLPVIVTCFTCTLSMWIVNCENVRENSEPKPKNVTKNSRDTKGNNMQLFFLLIKYIQ